MVLLGQPADVREGLLLAVYEPPSLLELRPTNHQPPVCLRLLVDATLLQGELQVLPVFALRETAPRSDGLAALLEEHHAATHPAHVLAELSERNEACGVSVDGLHQLLNVGILVREAQVGAHDLHVRFVELPLPFAIESLVGRCQRLLLGLQLEFDAVHLVLSVPIPGVERLAHILKGLVELVVFLLEVRMTHQQQIQTLLACGHDGQERLDGDHVHGRAPRRCSRAACPSASPLRFERGRT
mmetsp:Transcript_107951/g.344155  ORF Transcript_107951/g.344155 Transcript_107951/m.344155 type:complete len:242 (+) Transcript_107951:1422-2147(+)